MRAAAAFPLLAMAHSVDAAERQWWHSMIGLTPAIAAALNYGAGVRVGVLDGLVRYNHPDLIGLVDRRWRLPGASYSFFDDHATHLAGIIGARLDNSGTVGIAPMVRISNVALFDDNGWATNASTQYGLDRVYRDGGSIANLSYGPIDPGRLAFNDDLLAISAHANKLLVTQAAGNDGVALRSITWNTALNPLHNLIIVGAVDRNKTLAWFSNRPGYGCFKRVGVSCAAGRKQDLFMYRFLVAPGQDIRSTVASGGYATYSGTSMAAPMVAGAAALLQSRWAFLRRDPKRTADILLTTAQDLGAPGVDPVYGRGLLRIDRAMQAQGTLQVATGRRVDDTGAADAASAMRLSSAFGSGAALAHAMRGVVAFDAFQRDFAVDPRAFVQAPASQTLPLGPAIGILARDRSLVNATLGEAFSFSGSFPRPPSGSSDDPSGMAAGAVPAALAQLRRDDDAVWHASGRIGALEYSFGQRTDLARTMLPASPSSPFLADPEHAALPFQALGEQRMHGILRHHVSDVFGIGFGFAETLAPLTAMPGRTSTPPPGSGHAYVASLDVKANERVSVQLTQTYLGERGMTLGGTSGGAFDLGRRSTTLATGVSAAFGLAPDFNLRFHYAYGLTNAAERGESLFREVGALQSQAYGISFAKTGLLTAYDQIGFAVHRPLRIFDGSARLDVPIGRTVAGQVKYRHETLSLAPDGQQTDFELGYRSRLGSSISFGLNAFYQHDLNHTPGAQNLGGLVRASAAF